MTSKPLLHRHAIRTLNKLQVLILETTIVWWGLMEKEVLTFKAFRRSRDAYDRAAKQAGLTRSEWIRIVCDAACGISPLPEQLTRVVQFEAKPIRDGKW